MAWTSFDKPAPLFRFDNRTPGKIHPTQKPVELYSWLFGKFWTVGVVFDPMMGSQSSRIAAHFAGADFVGCELDPQYYAAGCARFEKASRQLLLPL
jgi:site-specific DNA-methyltransferase (adenine-specific)